MDDPYGALLTLIRDDTAVSAIVGQKVASQVNAGETPPLVVLVEDAATRRPFGAGTGRAGLQGVIYFARCYGSANQTGAIQARQLAGAVSDAVHNHPPATVGTKYLARVYAPELDGPQQDPDTRWPHVDVRIELYAAA